MKRRTKRFLYALSLAAGATGLTFMLRRKGTKREEKNAVVRDRSADRWARPGMSVSFRAELMPGRSRAERTFKVVKLLPSGRVILDGFAGEHVESEFEPIQR